MKSRRYLWQNPEGGDPQLEGFVQSRTRATFGEYVMRRQRASTGLRTTPLPDVPPALMHRFHWRAGLA